MSDPHPYCTQHDQPLEWCAHNVLLTDGPAGAAGMSVMDLLLQACHETPDWYHVSRQHWVMNLDWYKRVRREARAMTDPDPEPDEDRWVPGPHDTLFGYPIEVCEDGGKPHLVSDYQPGPPFTHTLKLPETEEEMAAEPPPSFTLEETP